MPVQRQKMLFILCVCSIAFLSACDEDTVQNIGDTNTPTDTNTLDTNTPADTNTLDTNTPADTNTPDTNIPADTNTLDTNTPTDTNTPDTNTPADTNTPDTNTPADTTEQDAGCERYTVQATPSSGALLVLIDSSASMSSANRWTNAVQGIVAGLDATPFNRLFVGLTVFPTAQVPIPACYAITGLTTVGCGIAAQPQIPPALASDLTSTSTTGPRRDIQDLLTNTTPNTADISDATPTYDTLAASYTALRALPIDRRAVLLISDGNASCAALSSPTRPGYSDSLCPDWEYPDALISLISSARDDASTPIQTFIIGVEGSNTSGQTVGGYSTAPYSMRLALSNYAIAGVKPEQLPTGCSVFEPFMVGNPDPSVPCHLDLSQSTTGGVAIADAIQTARRSAFECVWNLPAPPSGETMDINEINLTLRTTDADTLLRRRTDPSDPCADGCWDLEGDTLRLFGAACMPDTATTSNLDVVVGCATR